MYKFATNAYIVTEMELHHVYILTTIYFFSVQQIKRLIIRMIIIIIKKQIQKQQFLTMKYNS